MATVTKVYHRKPYPAIDPAAPQNSLIGRSILIVGASGGIGLATAHCYLQASPSNIIILGRRADALAAAVAELNNTRPTSSPTKITSKQCDITSSTQISALWSSLKTADLSIDILILNAALTSFSDIATLANFLPSFAVSVTANLLMADAFLAQGSKQGKVLINVSSMAAHVVTGTTLQTAAYGSSKAAGAAALQHAANAIPASECFILNVHPGAVLTEAARGNGYDENSIPWDEASLPGSFFVWASTPVASFLHGRFVWVNWDVDELVAMRSKFEAEHGFLKIGLQGIPPVDAMQTFGKIAELIKEGKA